MRTLLVLSVFLAVSLPGQQVTCGGLNHLTTTVQPYTLSAGLRLGVLYVPPASLQVDRLQWYFPTTTSGGVTTINIGQGTVEIRADAAGSPSPTVLAQATFSGTGPVISIAGGWQGGTFASPVILTMGIPYWLTYTRAPNSGSATVGVQNNPPGPDLTPTSIESNGLWGPVVFTDQFKVRLASVNCQAPGPAASWTTVGGGCAGSGTGPPTLTPVGLPVLGATGVGLTLAGAPPGSPFGLFWSVGADPIGLPLGGGCTLHLELTSFLALLALGFNPVAAGTLDASGGASVAFVVPSDPFLAGVGLGFQAALLVPYGVPTGAGTNYVLTACEVALVGW